MATVEPALSRVGAAGQEGGVQIGRGSFEPLGVLRVIVAGSEGRVSVRENRG